MLIFRSLFFPIFTSSSFYDVFFFIQFCWQTKNVHWQRVTICIANEKIEINKETKNNNDNNKMFDSTKNAHIKYDWVCMAVFMCKCVSQWSSITISFLWKENSKSSFHQPIKLIINDSEAIQMICSSMSISLCVLCIEVFELCAAKQNAIFHWMKIFIFAKWALALPNRWINEKKKRKKYDYFTVG